jgi:hypothetical protein
MVSEQSNMELALSRALKIIIAIAVIMASEQSSKTVLVYDYKD